MLLVVHILGCNLLLQVSSVADDLWRLFLELFYDLLVRLVICPREVVSKTLSNCWRADDLKQFLQAVDEGRAPLQEVSLGL